MRIVHSLVTLVATLGFAVGALTLNVGEVTFCHTPAACPELAA